jgi:hypothetical protein
MSLEMTNGSSRAALATWDTEGGAPLGATTPAVVASPNSTADDELLLRLGAALVREWSTLPTATQRALYGRAVAGPAPADDAALKRDMAIFLHDNKSPASQA